MILQAEREKALTQVHHQETAKLMSELVKLKDTLVSQTLPV